MSVSIDALNPKQDDGRAPMPSSGQVSVKIVVQRDTDPLLIPRSLLNFNILGAVHSDFGDVNGVEPQPRSISAVSGASP